MELPLHLDNGHHQGSEGELDWTRYSTSPPLNTAIMKLITATLLSALSCYTELAAAATGHVLTLNPSPSSQDQPANERRTLSPENARLVIAQRAGVEDYHVEKALSEEEIEAINNYGLQTHMLSADKEDARTFILAFVEESAAEGMLMLSPALRTYKLFMLTRHYSSCPKSTFFRRLSRSLSTGHQGLLR